MNRTGAQAAGAADRPSANLAEAGVKDTLAFFAEVGLPTFSKGVIARRPTVVALAERLDLDGRAVARMQQLRRTYGEGPLLLATPIRKQALVLSPDHVRHVLEGAPEPFAPLTMEKNSALAHFEPDVSLVSHGQERAERRRFNEEVLQHGSPVHILADSFMRVVDEEAACLVKAGEELDWDGFTIGWHRVVRRVVLGDGARDDHDLTDLLAKLRGAANWAFLHPGRPKTLERFRERLDDHLRRGDEKSLAGLIARLPKSDDTAPADQVAHFLFAFDPAGIATFRALALLAAHREALERGRSEATTRGSEGWKDLQFLRACVLESLRLWPTTPAIFRETTQETDWGSGKMPANTHILIFAPFFHRDEETLPYAHRFSHDVWLEADRQDHWPLVPFSGGPGKCPASHLVPMLASAMLAAIITRADLRLQPPDRLRGDEPMPGSFDNYSLRFRL